MKHIANNNRKHGFCGLNNLANILRNKNILDHISDEKYNACPITDFNEILENEGHGIYYVPIISMFDIGFGIPEDFLGRIIMDNKYFGYEIGFDNPFIAFTLVVQLGETLETNHAVSILRTKEKNFYSDPNFDEYREFFDIKNIFPLFKYCHGVYTFAMRVNDNKDEAIAVLDSEHFGYNTLFGKSELIYN